MSSEFVYFIPNSAKRVLNAADLRALGLAYALEGDSVVSREIDVGPQNLPGVLAMSSTSPTAMPHCTPQRQRWRKGPGGKYWVGMDVDAPPGPGELVRARSYSGTAVHLRDGNDWMIPRCVALLEGSSVSLPYVLDLADDGEQVTAAIAPQYQTLCVKAFNFWRQWSLQLDAKDPKYMNYGSMVRLACEALAVNYRLSTLEAVGMLTLIGTDELDLILRAIIEADEIEAYLRAMEQKKSGTSPQSDASTSCGSPADAPGTSLASPR